MHAEHWVQCLCASGKIISLTNIISPGATEMVSATDNSEREGSCISLSLCVCVCVCVCVCSVAQIYPILRDHMGCSPPGFSVHGIFHAKNAGVVAISFSRGSSWPRIKAVSLGSPALAGWSFTVVPPGKPSLSLWSTLNIHSHFDYSVLIIIKKKPNLLPSQLNWIN